MAWCTPLGDSLDEVWSALLAGESAIREVPGRLRLRSRLAAPLPATWPSEEEGGNRPADRHRAVAVATVAAALGDAGLSGQAGSANASSGILLVLGTSLGPHLDGLNEHPVRLGDWARQVADEVGTGRPPLSLSSACSSGADAIGLGARLVRSGRARVCVAGGIDLLTAAKLLGHSALGTMSKDGLRPFHEGRDGTVLGEGAAFLVLEPEAAATARGARSRGRVLGYGAANEAGPHTSTDASGGTAATAIRAALADAAALPSQVSVVSAHATGTVMNDAAEVAAVGQVFLGTSNRPQLLATKASLGHGLGATGAIEAVTVLLALEWGWVPPVLGGPTDPSLALSVAEGHPAPVQEGIGLSLNLGFGGFTSCVALGSASHRPGRVRRAGEVAGVRTSARFELSEPSVVAIAAGRSGTYADPVAWLISSTVLQLLAQVGDEDSRGRTGLIVASETATAETMRDVAAAAVHGRVSPMRFAAASPGTVVGVACATAGLRGPALLLTTRGDDPVPAQLVADLWLEDETEAGVRPDRVARMLVVGHAQDATGRHTVQGLVRELVALA